MFLDLVVDLENYLSSEKIYILRNFLLREISPGTSGGPPTLCLW